MAPVCLPLDDPLNHWKYCPSWPAAILFACLFGLTTILHIYQAWHYKKFFYWVLIMGALWEFISAVTRIRSIQDPHSKSVWQTSFVFLVLAPLWINAFDYMVLGRMIFYYLPDKQLAGIKGRKLAIYFVSADISSFIIQLAGALMTTSQTASSTTNGLHVYTAGVCLQLCVILAFFGLSVFFFRRVRTLPIDKDKKKAQQLMLILYLSLLLISYRICFRVVEYSAGSKTPLNKEIEQHEWYVYVFDVAPMFLTLVGFHIYHPGQVLVGPDSEYPQITKETKRQRKEEKLRMKEQQRRVRQQRRTANVEKGGSSDASELVERSIEV